MTTLKLKVKKIRRQPPARTKYNVKRLNDVNVQESFKVKIGGKFSPLMDLADPSIKNLTDQFTEGMNEVPLEVLGKEKKMKQPWITAEIMEKCDERRQLKATKYKDDESNRKYRNVNTKLRHEIKKAKETFLEGKCDEIESAFERNDSKTAYSVVKELTNEKSGRVSVIEDASGKLLTETSNIQAR